MRQIQSDIVTVEALSRLHPSVYASINNLDHEEEKRPVEEMYTEVLVEDGEKKESRLSEDVRDFNKYKNHFSKSTAEDSLEVRDLECLLDAAKELNKSKNNNYVTNRSSSAFGSLGA